MQSQIQNSKTTCYAYAVIKAVTQADPGKAAVTNPEFKSQMLDLIQSKRTKGETL